MRLASTLLPLLFLATLCACNGRRASGDGIPADSGSGDTGASADGGDAGPTDGGATDAGPGDGGSTDAGGGGDGGTIQALCLQGCELAHAMCGNTSDCATQCATASTVPADCATLFRTALDCIVHAPDLGCTGTALSAPSCSEQGNAAGACLMAHADAGAP